MHNPYTIDWTKVKHLLCYLKRAILEGLQIHKTSKNSLSIFNDADWARSQVY